MVNHYQDHLWNNRTFIINWNILFVIVIENKKPIFSNRKITFSYFAYEQDYRLRDFPVEKTNKTINKTKPIMINFEALSSRSTYFYHSVTQHLILSARMIWYSQQDVAAKSPLYKHYSSYCSETVRIRLISN